MPLDTMQDDIKGRDDEGNGSGSEHEGEVNEADVKETVEAMMASRSGDEGGNELNSVTNNADMGEGGKRKNKAVSTTPDRQTRDNRDGQLNNPTPSSERARGPDPKRKKNDIADFF